MTSMTLPRRVIAMWCLALALVAAVPAGSVAQDQPAAQDEFVPISELPPQDQLPAAPLLVAAYAFVWVAVFAYLVSIARRLRGVQQEVERLESDLAKGRRT